MTARPAVLVTDGDQRSALAVVRSLGAAGYPVYVCSSQRRSLAGASRYARAEATVTDPLEDPERCSADIRTLIDRWSIRVLIPMGMPRSSRRCPIARGSRMCWCRSPTDAVRRIADKGAMLEAAAGWGSHRINA